LLRIGGVSAGVPDFGNDGQRFVAWCLHHVLLLDAHETKAAMTDGQNDKQIDAILVEDGEEGKIPSVFIRAADSHVIAENKLEASGSSRQLWERHDFAPQSASHAPAPRGAPCNERDPTTPCVGTP